jgi:Fe-S-cluster containining protein
LKHRGESAVVNSTQPDWSAVDCQACGACCSFSREWPRFTLEDDDALALIPEALVNDALSGMRCVGDRCTALIGEIGRSTACSIYDRRPDVCRACQPGDDACQMARERFKLDDHAAAQPDQAG